MKLQQRFNNNFYCAFIQLLSSPWRLQRPFQLDNFLPVFVCTMINKRCERLLYAKKKHYNSSRESFLMGFPFPAMIHNFTERFNALEVILSLIICSSLWKGEKKTPRIDAFEWVENRRRRRGRMMLMMCSAQDEL
jgi:hypothetical protein